MTREQPLALPYYEDPAPGTGALPPRAWYPASDAVRLSLNGRWGFQIGRAHV